MTRLWLSPLWRKPSIQVLGQVLFIQLTRCFSIGKQSLLVTKVKNPSDMGGLCLLGQSKCPENLFVPQNGVVLTLKMGSSSQCFNGKKNLIVGILRKSLLVCLVFPLARIAVQVLCASLQTIQHLPISMHLNCSSKNVLNLLP